MSRPVGVPNGATRQAVLGYLAREADLDGLVTVSEQAIADDLGFSQHVAHYHLTALMAEGHIAEAGYSGGVKSHYIKAYQLADEVMA